MKSTLFDADNELSGGIPPELGGLAHLRSLALEGNELSGAIPLELAQLTNLNALTLGFNPDLNGTIPCRGCNSYRWRSCT